MRVETKSFNYEIIGGTAVYFPKAISVSKQLIAMVPAWNEYDITGYDDGEVKRLDGEVDLDLDESSANIFISEINAIMDVYKGLLGSNSKYAFDREYMNLYMSMYKDGGYISNHTDENHFEDKGTYTIAIYLNTPEGGGELGFTDYDRELPINEGDVVIFPFHYWHYSNPTVGVKYMILHRLYLEVGLS